MGLRSDLRFAVGLVLLLGACGDGAGGEAGVAGDVDRFCAIASEFDDDEPLAVEGEGEDARRQAVQDYFGRDEFRERMTELERAAPEEIAPVVEFVAVGTRMAAAGDFTRVTSTEGSQAQALLAQYRAEQCDDFSLPDDSSSDDS